MQVFNQFPSSMELEDRYGVNRRGQEEVVRQTFYDFQNWGASGVGVTEYSFFQVPVGQSGKTRADTNMTNAGLLPAPQKFLIQGVEIHFLSGLSPSRFNATASDANVNGYLDDVVAALGTTTTNVGGFLELSIGSKPYLTEAPLYRLPPKTRFKPENSIATNAAATGFIAYDYAVSAGRPYFLDPPAFVPSMQNFKVTINFPTAVTLPSALNARIGVVLEGLVYRLSQ